MVKKRSLLRRVLATLTGAALVVSASRAQETLTLDKAVNIALDQNYSLRGALHDRESAGWGKKNAIANFLPKVEITSSLTRIDPETEARANAPIDFIKAAAGNFGIPQSALANIKPFVYRDEYATSLNVVQPIYNGGAEIVGLNAANALQDKAEYAYEDSEQDVLARVKTSYFNVLKAQALVALTKESAERTNRWLEMTTRREKLGSRTETDVLRFEVQLAEDQGNIINAENGLAAAKLQLNEVLGVDLRRDFVLEDIVPADSLVAARTETRPSIQLASLSVPPDLDVVDPSFVEFHPSMKMMEANLRLAEVNIDRSLVNFKPRVNLAFQYGWEKNNTLKLDGIRTWALALSVSFPIFNGFGDYTNLQKAHADYDRAEEQVESYRRVLLMQATNAELAVKATSKRIDIARIGLKQAQDVVNSVGRRYDAGAASNVDVIDAQTAYTSARTNYITAVYDNRIAEVQLARAKGNIAR